jgi:hypothetical protein
MKKQIIFTLLLFFGMNVCTYGQELVRKSGRNGKWGFVDKSSGDVVVNYIYEQAGVFSDGFASVKFKGKYGIIDKTGAEIIPFQYTYAEVSNLVEEYREKYREEIEAIKQARKQELSDFYAQFGSITKEIIAHHKWDYSKQDYLRIVVFEQSSTIVIERTPLKFDDILGFEVFNNAKTIYSGTTAITSTNMTGSAIVTGGASAIIGTGRATARVTTVTTGQTATTKHNYDVVLTINNLSTPTLKVKFYDNQVGVQEFVSILSIIMHRKKENND